MLAVIHASEETPELMLLLQDLMAVEIPFKLYGIGEHWQNWGDKLRSHVKAAHEFPDETLLCIDGYDVRVIAPIRTNMPIPMFSAEKCCYPNPDLAVRFPPTDSRWKYLNAGTYICEAEWLRKIAAKASIVGVENDQAFWAQECLDSGIPLDTQCRWFQSAAFSHRGQFADYAGRLTNLSTMTRPAVLHFNGRTEQWEPDGKTGLEREAGLYQDTEEEAKRLVETFGQLVNETHWLAAHRDFAEKGYGCGDRSFHWLWHLLVGEMPPQFKFLEVGVYKGQILSLVQLLANQWGKEAAITGVTMLSDFSGSKGEFPKYEDRDYFTDIMTFHETFGLNFDPAQLIVGDSTADWVIDRAKSRAPFDLVYIDGSHEYEYVRADIEHYAPLVKPGGFLVMDDAACDCKQPWGFFQGIEPVTRATREMIGTNPLWEHVLTVMHNRVFRRKQ